MYVNLATRGCIHFYWSSVHGKHCASIGSKSQVIQANKKKAVSKVLCGGNTTAAPPLL